MAGFAALSLLQLVLNMWNSSLEMVLSLTLLDPMEFKGGMIWASMINVQGALKAAGYSLCVLFFGIGAFKSSASFMEIKRIEQVIKPLFRFILAVTAVTYAPDLLKYISQIARGLSSIIVGSSGMGSGIAIVIPESIVNAFNNVSFLNSIGIMIVVILGGLGVFVNSVLMVITVYKYFFKIFLFTAFAPISLSSFAGESTQNMGQTYIKKYAGACLEGCVMLLVCAVCASYVTSPAVVDTSLSEVAQVWSYTGEIILNMCLVTATLKLSERIVTDMTGL